MTNVETALEGSQLESARDDLLMANEIISKLEEQTKSIAILPKMMERRDQLTENVKDAFLLRWDQMVSVEVDAQGAVLRVDGHAEGRVFLYLTD